VSTTADMSRDQMASSVFGSQTEKPKRPADAEIERFGS
jgi:hypothetical protein